MKIISIYEHCTPISNLDAFMVSNYLYKLYVSPNSSDLIKVNKYLGIGGDYQYASNFKPSYYKQHDQYWFHYPILIFSVEYFNMTYEISIVKKFVKENGKEYENNRIIIEPTSEGLRQEIQLFEFISKESISGFSFKGKVIKYIQQDNAYFTEQLSIINPQTITLTIYFYQRIK
jgi:hypothetical protein